MLLEHKYPLPPLFFSFFFFLVYMLVLGQVRKGVKKGHEWQEPHAGCPAGLGKRFSQSPAGLQPPNIKKNKYKGREGFICAPKAKEVIVPYQFLPTIQNNTMSFYMSTIIFETKLNLRSYKPLGCFLKSFQPLLQGQSLVWIDILM